MSLLTFAQYTDLTTSSVYSTTDSDVSPAVVLPVVAVSHVLTVVMIVSMWKIFEKSNFANKSVIKGRRK